MKIIIYSDVHGNIFSLEKLYNIEKDADLYISLGDIVGYLPLANKCINFLKNKMHNTILIKGNHEKMFIEGKCEPECSEIAKQAFERAYSYFDIKHIRYLKDMIPEYQLNDYRLKHTIDNIRIYPDTILKSLDESWIVGHTHYQFFIKSGSFFLLNPGSLGQNRAKKSLSQYIVYNQHNNSFIFKSFDNSINRIVKILKNFNYPQSIIDYYQK